jgi:hypothetical protein
MSSSFTNHFSADDAALVLIDFQPQMFMGTRTFNSEGDVEGGGLRSDPCREAQRRHNQRPRRA